MGHLYLVRHGQSLWNRDDRFTGWVDVPLTRPGRAEMVAAGRKLAGIRPDAIFTSALRRTRESARILGDAAGWKAPTTSAWELNERFYGLLQGLNKQDAAIRFSARQVDLWRRGYAVRPPGGESLEDAGERVLPYVKREVLPRVSAGESILICSHGNTLRVIRMYLDGLDAETVTRLEVPTGQVARYAIGDGGKVQQMQVL